MNNVDKRKIYEKKIINFIKDTLTKQENEEFYVLEIDMYSPFYTFLGDDWYTGTLIVFCNEAYINIIRHAMYLTIYGPWINKRDHSKLDYQGFAKVFNINDFDKEQGKEVKSFILKQTAMFGRYKKLTKSKKYSYLDELIGYLNIIDENKEADNLINGFLVNKKADTQNFFIDLKGSYTLKK